MPDHEVHEIQLNGKQLVFLFMAATVVAVVIFLCGVMVGATYTNFTKRPPAFGWGTLVILGLCVLAVWGRRDLLSPWI